MSEQQADELAFMKKAVLWDKGNKVASFEEGKVFEHHLGAIKTPDGILLDEAAIPVLEQAQFFGIPVNG